MKKFKRVINKKTCLCASAVLLLFITTLASVSSVSSSTFAKYSKEVKLSPTWRIEIPAKATGTDPTPQPQEDPHIVTEKPNTVYQVKSGDTLSKIAEKFNITIEALAAYNNIENTDNIQVGAILRIPPKDYVPPVSSKPLEQKDNSVTEKTENSAAEDSSEPSAALPKSGTSKEKRSENETIVENSDGTSETDTALTSETTETPEEISKAVSADEEHIPLSDSNSDFQSEISRTPDNETE